jgi:hypothetical protein
MRSLLFALLFAVQFLSACKKDEITPSLEGNWSDLTGSINPDWHYHFDSGLLTQSYVIAGTTITSITFPYAIRDSIILIGGDTNNPAREWAYSFECNDVIRITEQGQVLNRRFWLMRE